MVATLCGWEGNRRSGTAQVMHYRLQWSNQLWAQSPWKGNKHPTYVYAPMEYGTLYLYLPQYKILLVGAVVIRQKTRQNFLMQWWTTSFWATITSNGLSYAMEPLSSLSVCNVGVSWPNGWMDQDATWYRGRPWPRPHCVRWGPSNPQGKGQSSLPTFQPTSVVAKRSPISATAEILLKKSCKGLKKIVPTAAGRTCQW